MQRRRRQASLAVPRNASGLNAIVVHGIHKTFLNQRSNVRCLEIEYAQCATEVVS
jgi:hypothetical protein